MNLKSEIKQDYCHNEQFKTIKQLPNRASIYSAKIINLALKIITSYKCNKFLILPNLKSIHIFGTPQTP